MGLNLNQELFLRSIISLVKLFYLYGYKNLQNFITKVINNFDIQYLKV